MAQEAKKAPKPTPRTQEVNEAYKARIEALSAKDKAGKEKAKKAKQGFESKLAEGRKKELESNPQVKELEKISNAISKGFGKASLVGGAVRDRAMGRESKDFDVEVFGMDGDKLETTLKKFGKVSAVGKQFGVYKLTTKQGEYDFSLPRRESTTGVGHKDFKIEADADMTVEEAASRRDFTMNAMAVDLKTGKLEDPFGGTKDIQEGVLRHTSDAFAEDPLRVMRAVKFAGRYGLKLAKETAAVGRKIKDTFKSLPVERVAKEWEDWGTKSRKPSAGLDVLTETEWVDNFPALKKLVGLKQEQEWHPEGDVWEHTKLAVDAVAEYADRNGITGEDKLVLTMAALTHDIGQACYPPRYPRKAR